MAEEALAYVNASAVASLLSFTLLQPVIGVQGLMQAEPRSLAYPSSISRAFTSAARKRRMQCGQGVGGFGRTVWSLFSGSLPEFRAFWCTHSLVFPAYFRLLEVVPGAYDVHQPFLDHFNVSFLCAALATLGTRAIVHPLTAWADFFEARSAAPRPTPATASYAAQYNSVVGAMWQLLRDGRAYQGFVRQSAQHCVAFGVFLALYDTVSRRSPHPNQPKWDLAFVCAYLGTLSSVVVSNVAAHGIGSAPEKLLAGGLHQFWRVWRSSLSLLLFHYFVGTDWAARHAVAQAEVQRRRDLRAARGPAS
eukprot:GGOE01061618.1.p1 GENE.GGOE01061618.1~~GGOE01061618.1.p1  ORF type:complete len:306 (+),score=62.58 GGOE01061618.1:85-1002(+)